MKLPCHQHIKVQRIALKMFLLVFNLTFEECVLEMLRTWPTCLKKNL